MDLKFCLLVSLPMTRKGISANSRSKLSTSKETKEANFLHQKKQTFCIKGSKLSASKEANLLNQIK